jgi:Basic region leucine zipper
MCILLNYGLPLGHITNVQFISIQSTAQFTFDVEPGVGIYDDKPLEYEQSLESKSLTDLPSQSKADLDPLTYQGLANYLDYELPQQRLAQPAPIQPMLQPRPVNNVKPAMPILAPRLAPAPSADGSPSFSSANFSANFGVPMIYPKPSSTEDKPSAGLKRKATDTGKVAETDIATDPNLDCKSAGEEDKRRRNTAASARFRVKKKQREQALEQTAKEMTDKADRLEGRVKELELEIKWLRSILIEKESRTSDASDAPAKQDVKAE